MSAPGAMALPGTTLSTAGTVRNNGRCAVGGNASFRMRDTAVRFRVNRSVPELVAPVALDGFFLADNGVSVIRGRFLPGRMEFDAGTIECGYRYVLTKTS